MPDEPTTDSKVKRYWMNQIKRSQKSQPIDEWKAAKDRLMADESIDRDGDKAAKPYVNGYRIHYEALKSFLDQSNAEFKITPSEPFMTDQLSLKQAECDSAYLTYIWSEQKCQRVESKKLDSAIIRNIGGTCPFFDKKKWMPGLKYIRAENILLDPDCNGVDEDAKWQGYIEYVTTEELKARNKNLTDDEIKAIKSVAGSLLDEEEQNEDPELNKMFTVVRLYHIFARGDAAIRETEDDEEKIPSKSLVEEMELAMPKRYIQLVKGHPKPLKDTDEWPYELDDNEFPISLLRLNTVSEETYSFTDYKQMSELDTAYDNIMHDMIRSAYWAGNKKFAGSVEAGDLTAVEVEKFLSDPKKQYFPNMIGSDGKSKIVEIDTGQFSPDLVLALKAVDEARDKASALGELMSFDASQFKDVTAIAARIYDSNIHQKVNRRLGGPEGYEVSIAEDAVKILEIAHQFVPRYSVLEVPTPRTEEDESGVPYRTGETFMDYVEEVPWDEAQQALVSGATLVKLGIDAIVGKELAKFWRTTEETPLKVFKLSTKIRVIPGSTRTITKEHRAAILKQYYLEMLQPMYEKMGRWDLAVSFMEHILTLIGVNEGEDYLPSQDEVQQFIAQQQQAQEMQQQIEMMEAQAKIQPPQQNNSE